MPENHLTASRRDFPPRTDRQTSGSPSTSDRTEADRSSARKTAARAHAASAARPAARLSARRLPAPQDRARCLASHSPRAPAASRVRPPLHARASAARSASQTGGFQALRPAPSPLPRASGSRRSQAPARAAAGSYAACQGPILYNRGSRFPCGSA